MATNLRDKLANEGSIYSNLDGGAPTSTNNGATISGLTPINNTFDKGTYLDTLLGTSRGTFDRARATDPLAGPSRVGGI
jgi:hypothetical protein